MKILIAPQAFKGTISSTSVAKAIGAGVLEADPSIETILMPISDGGNGFLDVMLGKGKKNSAQVKGPNGAEIEAEWGIDPQGAALIETAKICGLGIGESHPMLATSYGVGQMIRQALDHGVKKIIIGVGGTATHDVGVGLVRALGGKFLDGTDQEVPFGDKIEKVDLSQLDPRLQEVEIIAVCDVNNPLCGPEGAAQVYAPQKGANHHMVQELEQITQRLLDVVGNEDSESECAGAGGGLAFGLKRFLGAKLCKGSEFVLSALNFNKEAKKADYIITGEGRLDGQTAFNKGPFQVLQTGKATKIMIVGSIGYGYTQLLALGDVVIIPLRVSSQGTCSEKEIKQAAYRIFNFLKH